MSSGQSAITNQSSWFGFANRGGGIDPGNFRVRPRVDGIVEIWKEFRSGDGRLFSPGTTGLGVGPRGNCRRALVPRAPTNKTITRWSWGFRTARGRIEPGDVRFRRWVAGVV